MKASQILAAKKVLAKKQGYECDLCSIDLHTMPTKNWCLDHDHTEGHVRGVLCRNCNGIEGKIHNLARRAARGRSASDLLQRVLSYWERHTFEASNAIFHPSHKTKDEKRLATNKKARMARAKKKAMQNIKRK